LKQRGLQVADEAAAEECLHDPRQSRRRGARRCDSDGIGRVLVVVRFRRLGVGDLPQEGGRPARQRLIHLAQERYKARAGESVYTIGGHIETVPYAYAFRYAPLVAYTVAYTVGAALDAEEE